MNKLQYAVFLCDQTPWSFCPYFRTFIYLYWLLSTERGADFCKFRLAPKKVCDCEEFSPLSKKLSNFQIIHASLYCFFFFFFFLIFLGTSLLCLTLILLCSLVSENWHRFLWLDNAIVGGKFWIFIEFHPLTSKYRLIFC